MIDLLDPPMPTQPMPFDGTAQMDRLVADFAAMYHERNLALREVIDAHHEALFRLAIAAEYRDNDTGVHIVRIGFLAEALALALGQGGPWAEMLRRAAPMHDVGKIGIPDMVLKKPEGFSAEERALMNTHTQIGADILGRSKVPLFKLASEIALTHHERFNGRGYPNGLRGASIPLSGRIVAVVDFFDALTMDRCYRDAMSDGKVKDMMRAERAEAFDPVIVDLFLAQWDTFTALRDRVNQLQLTFADLIRDGLGATRLLEKSP